MFCVCSGEMELEFWIGLAFVQSTFSLFQLIKGVKGGIHCEVKEMQKQCTSTYKNKLKGLGLELGLDFGERWVGGWSVLHPPHLFSNYLYSSSGLGWVVGGVGGGCDCCLCATVVQKSLCLF